MAAAGTPGLNDATLPEGVCGGTNQARRGSLSPGLLSEYQQRLSYRPILPWTWMRSLQVWDRRKGYCGHEAFGWMAGRGASGGHGFSARCHKADTTTGKAICLFSYEKYVGTNIAAGRCEQSTCVQGRAWAR